MFLGPKSLKNIEKTHTLRENSHVNCQNITRQWPSYNISVNAKYYQLLHHSSWIQLDIITNHQEEEATRDTCRLRANRTRANRFHWGGSEMTCLKRLLTWRRSAIPIGPESTVTTVSRDSLAQSLQLPHDASASRWLVRPRRSSAGGKYHLICEVRLIVPKEDFWRLTVYTIRYTYWPRVQFPARHKGIICI